jgi:hypothetical protein
MKKILKVLLIIALTWVFSLFLPFWGAALAGFIGSLVIDTTNVASFFTGFVAVFLVWGLTAFFIDLDTQHIMSDRIGQLFGLTPPFLVLVSAILGGITGGLGSLTGCTLKATLK